MKIKFGKMTTALLLWAGVASSANAAQQCFVAGGPTVYGAVTVTVTGCGSYVFGYAPFVANESQLILNGNTCTYAFSKPLVTSTITVQVNSVDSAAAITISTSAGAYSSAVGDIGVPLAGSASTAALLVNGTGYIGAAPEASSTLTLTNGAPASISSIAVTQTAGNGGSLLKVCADDAGVAVAPAAASPVPAMSEWGLLLLSALLAAIGLAFVRKKRGSRPNL